MTFSDRVCRFKVTQSETERKEGMKEGRNEMGEERDGDGVMNVMNVTKGKI